MAVSPAQWQFSGLGSMFGINWQLVELYRYLHFTGEEAADLVINCICCVLVIPEGYW